ncbi:hypothetical protein ACFQE8_05115 [Salinirubellus sp. GCM10025818]|jgi:hypothetical protein|uniref:hypothetical protein n=1 Tax=Salinirubellus TaxID=2162630 RepID=UPI0030D2E6A6
MTSLRTVVQDCLGKGEAGETISVREDVLGVYGDDNPQARSVVERLDRIQTQPFIRIALVTVRPTGSPADQNANLQRDIDSANIVYQNECGVWVYPVGSRVISTDFLGDLVQLDQDDCLASGHSVSDEEDALFDLGRDMGAEIVGYYINSDMAGFRGCAAHPKNRLGFWVGSSATRWTLIHELTHIVGRNGHRKNDTKNLMFTNTGAIQDLPPDLTDKQCERIHDDKHMESC